MGSTCAFALVQSMPSTSPKSWRVTAVNVGDSRVMIVRANGKLVSMTEDHKPDDSFERARIEKANGMVKDNRVDGGLAMSRAMGDFVYKMDAELSQTEQKVIALPDITHNTAYPGDRLLVICDGIVERIENKDVASFVHARHRELPGEPAEVMRDLLFYSLACGSTDNQSGILACFEDGSDYGRPDQFMAGPLSHWKADHKFVSAYFKNAEAWGQTPDSLAPLINKAEQSIPADWRQIRKPEVMNSDKMVKFVFSVLALLASMFCYVLLFGDKDYRLPPDGTS